MMFRAYRIGMFRFLGLGFAVASAPGLAATDYPIDGSNSIVTCAGSPQLTGRKFGSYPSTVTGCVLAGNWTAGLPQVQSSVTCKGGHMISFYPGAAKLKSCTLAMDQSPINASGGRTPCKGGAGAEFREDGRLGSCTGVATPTGGNTGGGNTGGGNTGGGNTGGGNTGGGNTGGGNTGGGTGGGTGGNTGGGKPPQASTGASVTVPGESGRLSGAGQYTKIGASSNRPGGRGGYLYLGDGRASAAYTTNVPSAGKYALWIRFDDDGKHAAGARAVEVSVNGATALRWGNPSQDTKGWVNINIGTVDLRAGQNTIVFTKAATSSAAFVLDEFVLSSVAGHVPQ